MGAILINGLQAALVGITALFTFVLSRDIKKIKIKSRTKASWVWERFRASPYSSMPLGGETTGLGGWKLILAIGINFFLGGCSAIGIGCYVPMMAMVYALGMSPRVTFPIMMGSYAFLMPAAGMKFIKEGAYDIKADIADAL